MHPLRGNVLSTVHCRTDVEQQRTSKHLVFLQFVSLGFLCLFVYSFVYLLVLAHKII